MACDDSRHFFNVPTDMQLTLTIPPVRGAFVAGELQNLSNGSRRFFVLPSKTVEELQLVQAGRSAQEVLASSPDAEVSITSASRLGIIERSSTPCDASRIRVVVDDSACAKTPLRKRNSCPTFGLRTVWCGSGDCDRDLIGVESGLGVFPDAAFPECAAGR